MVVDVAWHIMPISLSRLSALVSMLLLIKIINQPSARDVALRGSYNTRPNTSRHRPRKRIGHNNSQSPKCGERRGFKRLETRLAIIKYTNSFAQKYSGHVGRSPLNQYLA